MNANAPYPPELAKFFTDVTVMGPANYIRVPANGHTGFRAAPREPLPFFLDPEQIRELTPHIDWDKRVDDRIRAFLNLVTRRS